MTTPLGRRIAARIAAEGPIALDAYMAACLFDPEGGYYTTAPVFGGAGDFITAPEISQMFGELIGLALGQVWRDQGAPGRITLAELGPGRGVLMADLWRAAGKVAGFQAAADLWLIEASPRLAAIQAERLAHAAPRFATDAAALPEGPLYLVANEFFDALPVRQFLRTPEGWAETVVGLGPDGALQPGRVPVAAGLPRAIARRTATTPPGTVLEHCPAAPAIMAEIAGRIARHGGVAIVIDYGGWDGQGDTLQAIARHRPTDPFAAPGTADLTAHVDFAPLAAAASAAGAEASGPVAQGAFLGRLGIGLRAEVLARGLAGASLAAHRAATARLTDPSEMGTLFKVLAIHPRGTPPPPGLTPDDAAEEGPRA
jgi:SAM-dependent MidA family methyltransferase